MRDFEISIGKLNKRITFEKLIEEQNENGFDVKNWQDYKTVWASANNLFGKEFYAAKAIQAENTVEFIVRYSKELENLNSQNYRINWNSRIFNITFIDNIQYSNKWLKIKAIEVV